MRLGLTDEPLEHTDRRGVAALGSPSQLAGREVALVHNELGRDSFLTVVGNPIVDSVSGEHTHDKTDRLGPRVFQFRVPLATVRHGARGAVNNLRYKNSRFFYKLAFFSRSELVVPFGGAGWMR